MSLSICSQQKDRRILRIRVALGSSSQFRANPVHDRIAVNECAKHLLRLDFLSSSSAITSQLPKADEYSIHPGDGRQQESTCVTGLSGVAKLRSGKL